MPQLQARLDAMPARERAESVLSSYAGSAARQIGKIAEATSLLGAYLKTLDTPGLRVNWITLLERQEQSAELLAYLSANPDLLNGTPFQRLQYAHVLRRQGFIAEALSVGYETTRRAMRDANDTSCVYRIDPVHGRIPTV